jgi:hypothetical protein
MANPTPPPLPPERPERRNDVSYADLRMLGATILGPRAGDLIGARGFAISAKPRFGAVAGVIPPYRTLSEISKRAAGGYYTPKLFGPLTRRIVGFVERILP